MSHGTHRLSTHRRNRGLQIGAAAASAAMGAAALATIALPGTNAAAASKRVELAAASSTAVALAEGFEQDVSGWKSNAKAVKLSWLTPGRNSNGAAKLVTGSTMNAVLDEQRNSVSAAVKGNIYEVTAFVRTTTPGVNGVLRMREMVNGSAVGVETAPFQLTDRNWQKLTVSYKAQRAGSAIDVNVVGWKVVPGEVLLVDDITLTRTAPADTPTPTPTPTSTPTPTPTSTPTPTPTSTPTPTPTSTPTPTPTPPAPAPGKGPVYGFGMSAPADQWDARLAEVGPGLKSRRIFLTGFTAGLSLPQRALSDRMYPVISFKTGGIPWADVAAGKADDQLRALAARLDALPGNVFVAIHHEPAKDGAAADWAAMQVHALPILGAPDNVTVGVIGNGWWWSAQANGYTDAEIAQYLPPGVLRVAEVIASDTYHGGSEDAGVKIRRMSAWADRVGVTKLGIGEFNGSTGQAITNAMDAVKADPRYQWANVFNSNVGIGEVLIGDRLAAFREGLL